MHAQEIVLELQGSLRVDAWDGAAQLSQIYSFLHSEMVRANVSRDVERLAAPAWRWSSRSPTPGARRPCPRWPASPPQQSDPAV